MEVTTGTQLVVVTALLFFGALGAGYLPYFISIGNARFHTVSALGGGLLIGSALAVVIPEGFASFQEAAELALTASHTDDSGPDGHPHAETPHGMTGLALVAGFLAMIVLDQLQIASDRQNHHHHTSNRRHPGCISPEESPPPKHAASVDNPSSRDIEALDAALAVEVTQKVSTANLPSADRAITGLLVHCAADGLAMGSAFLSGNASLGFIVGMAMVLHKAPMAFGLAAFLQSCHWPWARAQRTLVIFAAAAPTATLLTYVFLSVVPLFTTPTAVSLCVLFSGGTFLQAATMHILPEVVSHSSSHVVWQQLAAFGIGSLIPVLLSWGHHH